MSSMIEVIHLTAHYEDMLVLDDITFTIEKGQTTVILGKSGVGKSTLLRCLIGLLKPTSGHILVEGQDITTMAENQLDEIRKDFGMLFQSGALFNSLTVAENVAFPLLEHTNMDRGKIEEIVRTKLELVGLGGCEHLMPAQLSGGMKKRAALARAMALDPTVLFFDEPNAGLDPIMAIGIDNLIIRLQSNLGVTIVVVTHNLESTFRIANKIIMLLDGKIIASGTQEEIKRSDNPAVIQFLQGKADESYQQELAKYLPASPKGLG